MRNLPFILLFVLISCGKPGAKTGCQDMVCEVSAFSLDTTEDGDVPPEAEHFDTNLILGNFDDSQREKVENAAILVKRVISSREFKDAIVNHTVNGVKTFADNNGLTNLQIYNRIIIASEKVSPAKNYVLDVELELYYENSSTIGYTFPDSTRIWMNTKFFNTFTPYKVADNLTHEWIHKLGFTHDVAATVNRPNSVPYAVGYIVRDLAGRMFPGIY